MERRDKIFVVWTPRRQTALQNLDAKELELRAPNGEVLVRHMTGADKTLLMIVEYDRFQRTENDDHVAQPIIGV